MKKVISLAVLTALVLGFSGCESKEDKEAERLTEQAHTPAKVDFSNIDYGKDKEKQEILQHIEGAKKGLKASEEQLARVKQRLNNPDPYNTSTETDVLQTQKMLDSSKKDVEYWEKKLEELSK
jgi:septal ring factor EnvC (AmiA/AmiB activator)